MKKVALIIITIFSYACLFAQQQQLAKQNFKNPPASYKPLTWFHAIDGNMSKAGLTKDLESIQKVGIGGILLFNIAQKFPKGKIIYNSPEHHEMLTHAAKECERLGLSFGVHNCDGWSSSGGPWMTPEQSMKMVVWSETISSGGKISIQLPQPTTRNNYYEEIAVLAYPAFDSEIRDFENMPLVTASDEAFNVKIATDNRLDGVSLLKKQVNAKPWIQYEYPTAHEIRSVFLVFEDRNGEAELQVSDDGVNFKTIRTLFKVRTGKNEWAINDSFEPLKSKFFRLQLNQQFSFKEARLLSTQQLHNVLGRISMGRTENQAMTPIGQPTANMVVDKSKIINLSDKMDAKGNLIASLPEGKWTIMRFGYTSTGAVNSPASDEGRGLECDKFSREAFLIHYNAFSKKVIDNAKSIAPNAMQYIEIDSYEMGGQNWTKGYNSIFKKEKGYDIVPFLPLFAGRFVESAQATEAVLYDVRQLNCDLMTKNYFAYFTELCAKDGVKSYIEPYGFGPVNDLDVGKYATINMGEFWMNREMNMVQSAVSASHIYGKNVISAESFTSTPEINWKGNPAMAKNSGDLSWTYGINEFMFHRFAHQPNTQVKPGMTMGRWGFHFDRAQTWWENAGADWFKYIARGQYLLRQGVPVSDLLVFIGEGAPNSVYLRSNFEPQIPNNVNYDCVNTDVLLNRIQLKNKLMVLPEGTQYKALVLKGCEQLSLKTLKRISEISKAGIPVIGPRPTTLAGYTVAEEDKKAFASLVNEIWGNANVYTDYNWNEVLTKEGITPDFSVAGRNDIKFSHRSTENEEVYFIFNPDSVQQMFECKFRVDGKIPELWNPMTGESHKTAQFIGDNGNTKVWIKLQAGESMFVVFKESAKGIKIVTEPVKFAESEYQLEKNNKIRSISPSKIAPLKIEGEWEVEFLKENDYAAKHIFPTLTDWKDDKNENIKYYSGTAVYRKTFSVGKKFLKKKNQYWLNLGDVKIVAEVILNGKKVAIDWMPPFTMDVTNYLKSGANQLEIRVTNQWSNRMIGDERYPAISMEKVGSKSNEMADWYVNNEPAPDSKRTTFSTAQFYKKTDELMPSGLVGPVSIEVKNQRK